jgi:uncharacterized protein with GYD domain
MEESRVTTFVALIRFPGVISYTPDGIRIPKDILPRLERVREAFRSAGAEVKSFDITTGRYDAVALLEVGDDALVTKAVEVASRTEPVRTELLHVVSVAELAEIVARPVYA